MTDRAELVNAYLAGAECSYLTREEAENDAEAHADRVLATRAAPTEWAARIKALVDNGPAWHTKRCQRLDANECNCNFEPLRAALHLLVADALGNGSDTTAGYVYDSALIDELREWRRYFRAAPTGEDVGTAAIALLNRLYVEHASKDDPARPHRVRVGSGEGATP